MGLSNVSLGLYREPFELVPIKKFYEESMDGENAEVDEKDLILIINCEECSFIDFVSVPFWYLIKKSLI